MSSIQTFNSMAVSQLRPNAQNARSHTKKQIRQIADSITRFGWVVPIVVDESTKILAGHGRYHAAKLLGLKQVPVVVLSGLSEADKRLFTLADNKIAINAGWDRELLAQEFASLMELLPNFSLDINLTGFEPFEIDSIQADLVDAEHDPSDDVPAPELQAVARLGETWLLGNHRLVCGDVRDGKVLQQLMGRCKAAMTFTDPPYNVRVKDIQGRGRIKHREFAAASGEMSKVAFTEFLVATCNNITAYSDDGAIVFICIDWRHIGELLSAGDQAFTELKNLVVWNKTNAGQGSFYRSKHELICIFKCGTAPHINNFELGQNGRYRSNVWTYPGVNTFRSGRMDELAMHPTVKPVALVADAMRDCSRRGSIILDVFAGSGTTIMAAEQIGRRAFCVEIDPLYVDVCIRRWQRHTGKDATLESTGQTFDEVMAGRANKQSQAENLTLMAGAPKGGR